MNDIKLDFQSTSHGARFGGPEPETVRYMNGHSGNGTPKWELLWASSVVEVWLQPTPNGGTLRIRVRGQAPSAVGAKAA